MLSDENSMNLVNPFVQHEISLPGAIGQHHQYKQYKPPVETDTLVKPDDMHICEYGITSGDKVIDACRPSKVKCQLSRPLVPGRNIDMGVDETKPESIIVATATNVVRNVAKKVKKMKTLDIITILLLVAIILVLSSVKR